jgi:hypothetical protein
MLRLLSVPAVPAALPAAILAAMAALLLSVDLEPSLVVMAAAP